MFSKPILIAASVATAQAALMAAGNTAQAEATDFSDVQGCGKCLEFGTASKYIMGGAVYETIAAQLPVSIAAGELTGDICCMSDATKEKAPGVTYCGGATFASVNAKNVAIQLAANQYFQSALAQCPFFKDICVMVAKTAADATDADTAVTDQRYAILKKAKIGSYVTLTMKALTSATSGTGAVGAAPSLKQRVGDVCTFVVAAECDAPVITVATGNTAIDAEWKVQVTEWSAEFLQEAAATDSGTGVTWLATGQVGTTAKLYPPLTAAVNTAIKDLQAAGAPLAIAPNDLMGDISFLNAVTATDYSFEKIPGNIISEWNTWLASVYTSKTADNAAYATELAKWVTFLAYEAPAPGLFVPAVDPKAPAKMSKPRAPTQAVDTPSTLANFAFKTPATAALNLYNQKAGYGYPSAYGLTLIKDKSGKPFGTLAGGAQATTPTVAWAATQNVLSVRKTSNKAADGVAYITACDKSYLMITGVLQKNAATAMTVELKVTSQEFQKTLAEQIPVRSGAPTSAADAPAGAAQLAASAVAAALTALYLF